MSPRKVLVTLGRKRKPNYVRVFTETVGGVPYVRVQWKEDKRLRTESWDDTRKGHAEAKAFAEGVHERLSAPPVAAAIAPITLRTLWEKYALANEDALAKKGFATTTSRWRKFEIFAGRDTVVSSITLERMDEFKRAMLENKHAVNQVALHLGIVRLVTRWGVQRDLLAPTKITEYRAKFSKEMRLSAPKMAEYSAAEARRIVAELSPRDSRTWRAWALTLVFAFTGRRENAALHLAWDDIDFDAGMIRWPAETDKMGREWWLPMAQPVREALYVALGWRRWAKYEGRYVFFGMAKKRQQRDEPYTYSAYMYQLREAEQRAKVPYIKWRGAHGFRRGLAGNVLAVTGSSKRAAQVIGDKDTRIVDRHYIQDRPEELREIVDQLGAGEAVPMGNSQTLQNATATPGGVAESELSHD